MAQPVDIGGIDPVAVDFPVTDFIPRIDAKPLELDAQSAKYELASAQIDAVDGADKIACVLVPDTTGEVSIVLQILNRRGEYVDHAAGTMLTGYKPIIAPATNDWQPSLECTLPRGAVTRWVMRSDVPAVATLVDRP